MPTQAELLQGVIRTRLQYFNCVLDTGSVHTDEAKRSLASSCAQLLVKDMKDLKRLTMAEAVPCLELLKSSGQRLPQDLQPRLGALLLVLLLFLLPPLLQLQPSVELVLFEPVGLLGFLGEQRACWRGPPISTGLDEAGWSVCEVLV